LLPCEAGEPVLDVGSGEGAFLGELTRRYAIEAYGVDLSTAAADLAARRHRSCRWIVANADRFIPFGDESLHAVTSINARLNRDEFARVLRPVGRLLLAVAAPDDLLEVRERILGAGVERSRVDRTREMFEPVFELVHLERVSHRATLDHEALVDVLSSSYRGLRLRERERLTSIDSMDVTLSRDVLLFRKVWT
ncbi:MAG: methyltransferase domain-containing protein, partial [Thermoanaerobaculia bacterium]